MSTPFFPDVIVAWKAAAFVDGNQIPANELLEAASKFILIFGKLWILFCAKFVDMRH
jgi:hypothetical protein